MSEAPLQTRQCQLAKTGRRGASVAPPVRPPGQGVISTALTTQATGVIPTTSTTEAHLL
ncbi:hypothetical protein T484DRAFT_3545725 [Baffinella frigidus]|nr:hypothetical protein T484DRAFT_3545725 [Cryptophyta sp. CCMP2293]